MEETVGDLCESTFSFQWKIENFSSLSYKNCDKYQTPSFQCLDAAWRLFLYPNGFDKTAIGWISVILKKQHPKDSEHVVDFKISAKCGDKIMHSREWSKADFSRNKSLGWRDFLKRDEVLEKLRTASQKVLTVSCVITRNASVGDADPQGNSLENVSVPPTPKASLETLSRNLKELYINKSNWDFTINVRDQVLTAHKAIIGARSPVFAAMFAHDTAENLRGTMKIDDFEPDIVKDFLMYMYTGDVENLSWNSVFDLYAISDKYDVQDLKEECREFMKSKLSLETVCEVLLLAEKYAEMELFEFAKKFVAKNATELLTREHWEKLGSENLLLAHKVLKMIVLDNAWRIK